MKSEARPIALKMTQTRRETPRHLASRVSITGG
jgi:hypothetical protein